MTLQLIVWEKHIQMKTTHLFFLLLQLLTTSGVQFSRSYAELDLYAFGERMNTYESLTGWTQPGGLLAGTMKADRKVLVAKSSKMYNL